MGVMLLASLSESRGSGMTRVCCPIFPAIILFVLSSDPGISQHNLCINLFGDRKKSGNIPFYRPLFAIQFQTKYFFPGLSAGVRGT